MADYSRDRVVTAIAGGQRKLVSTTQLWECGLDKDAVARRVGAGWLRLVFQGVYSVGSGELAPLALEQAALMSCGRGSLISHRSAAFVWGCARARRSHLSGWDAGRARGSLCIGSGRSIGGSFAGSRGCG